LYKLVLFMLLAMLQLWMLTLQLEEELSMHMLFELKHGVNRAAHAASVQIDEHLLAEGIRSIEEVRAREMGLLVLRENLRLNEAGEPLAGSLLREPIELLAFEVINSDEVFPYRYVNKEHDYEVILQNPGVIFIIRAEYPRLFRVIEPIVWTVKGTSELYVL
jgi:hypothetical protein